MTLFSVGFSFSVKAANDNPIIRVVQTEDLGLKWMLDLTYSQDKNCFPDVDGGKYTYKFKYIGEANDKEHILELETKIMSASVTDYIFYLDGSKFICGINANFPFEMNMSLPKNEVKSRLGGPDVPDDADIKSFEFGVEPTDKKSEGEGAGEAKDIRVQPLPISSFKVNTKQISEDPKFKLNYSINEGSLTEGYTHLLPKEKITITAAAPNAMEKQVEADGEEPAYRWGTEWTASKDGIVSFSNIQSVEKTKQCVDVTMTPSPQGPVDIFPKIGAVTMFFTPDINEKDTVLEPEGTLGTRTTTIKATKECQPYSYENGDVASVKVNNTDVVDLKWSGATFDFTLSDETPVKEKSDLLIEMTDGNVFHRSLKITAPEQLKVKVEPSVKNGGTVKVYNETKKKEDPSSVDAEEKDKITVTAQANEEADYRFVEWEVIPEEAVAIDIESPIANFDMGDESVTLKAIFVKKSDINIKPVKVTVGKTVKMSDFVTPKTAELTVSSNDEDFITVKPDGVSKAATGIEIYGVKTTSSIEGLRVASSTMDERDVTVEVYNIPLVGRLKDTYSEASGLGVVLPDGVCYNNSGSLTQYNPENFTVVYRYNSDTEKNENIDFVDVKRFSKAIDSLLDGDNKGTVSVTAYPVNPNTETTDKNVASKPWSTDVYKIKLDGSAGANYKVNDKEIEDYFYAIDGYKYKISATNKSGYTSTIEKWEGDEVSSFGTSTSGTAIFEDATTIKAVFKSSTSSSSSSSSSYSYYSSSSSNRTTAIGAGGTGSGGDYDDVPRTGESKTDIWILWSVLLASILGAGFMIYKRFGLVRAIAEADKEVAEAAKKESVMKQEKEKENILKTLKGLRKL